MFPWNFLIKKMYRKDLSISLNKQVSRTYHFALEQSMAEIKNNFTRKDRLFWCMSKNIDLALNKKMVAIFFVSYRREAEK